MKILVTGAHGFVLGVFAARLLREPGIEVVTADLGPAPVEVRRLWGEDADRARSVIVDVTDRARVARLVAEERPDVIVHGATLTQAPGGEAAGGLGFVDVNVVGSANVADAAARCDAVRRLVHVSSGSVYGPPVREAGGEADAERTACEPLDLYAISKLAGERVTARICELRGILTPRLRLANVFGHLERPTGGRTVMSVPTRLVEAHLRGRPLANTAPTLDAASDWIGAVDVAAALLAACTGHRVRSRAYNVATGRCTTVRELIEHVGLDVRIDDADGLDMDPDGSSYAHGSNLRYDVRDTSDQLGWRARPIGEQLAEFLDWAGSGPHDSRPRPPAPTVHPDPAGA